MKLSAGKFFLIGGGPAARTLGEPLLEQFITAAGGKQAEITIITAGSEEPEEVNACYWDIFTALGVNTLFSPKITCRAEAEDPAIAARIVSSSAVFIAGGAQTKLVERLLATAVATAIAEVFARGGILSGTSAGASIFAHPMILEGGTVNRHLRHEMIDIGPGLGLLGNNIAVDTHCSSRGRIPRLVSLLLNHPDVQVIGIDEDTALFIHNDGVAEVIGHHAVYLLDGLSSSIAEKSRSNGNISPTLSISEIKLHCLTNGARYDIINRQTIED
jgi:cyanophycinase